MNKFILCLTLIPLVQCDSVAGSNPPLGPDVMPPVEGVHPDAGQALDDGERIDSVGHSDVEQCAANTTAAPLNKTIYLFLAQGTVLSVHSSRKPDAMSCPRP